MDMQTVFNRLAIAVLLIPIVAWQQAYSTATPTIEISQAQQTANTTIPVALPVSAKVWLKAGGTTTGKVTGFDSQQQVLTLGGEPIQLAKISKVMFDRKALAYHSDGKRVIRGEDTAQATPTVWENISLSAFELKDPKLGQAQVNLGGVVKPLQLKGIRAVAVNSVYVVDEFQFRPTGKMTLKVTPSDR